MKVTTLFRKLEFFHLLVFLSLLVTSANAEPDGIYADFSTSMGSFTCRLEYAVAPKAVANFIGLATGKKAWLNKSANRVQTSAYFNGLIFHRVIAGFVIQSGSPDGQGTGGPGYAFIDEVSLNLKHDTFGTLSMANSGPDSNGSQFFVTAAPRPDLDGGYSVFGKLTGGSNVVYAINHVATDGGDKPITNVVLQSVVIRRIGTAALAFDSDAQGLPLVTNIPVTIGRSGPHVSVNFSNRLYAQNWFYASSNLTQWTPANLGIEVSAPSSNSVLQTASGSNAFFRMTQIQYQSSTFAPKSFVGRFVTNVFDGGLGTIVIRFTSPSNGYYTFNGGATNAVTSYTWIQEPYRGQINPIYYSGLFPMILRLDFQNASSGTLSGAFYNPFANSVSGKFTLGP